MRNVVRRTLLVTLLVAVVAGVLALWLAGGPQMSETSSTALAAQPTPTYVSELAPAVSVAPRQAASLPATGGVDGVQSSLLLPKVAGLALALTGVVLIHAGLRRGPGRAT